MSFKDGRGELWAVARGVPQAVAWTGWIMLFFEPKAWVFWRQLWILKRFLPASLNVRSFGTYSPVRILEEYF